MEQGGEERGGGNSQELVVGGPLAGSVVHSRLLHLRWRLFRGFLFRRDLRQLRRASDGGGGGSGDDFSISGGTGGDGSRDTFRDAGLGVRALFRSFSAFLGHNRSRSVSSSEGLAIALVGNCVGLRRRALAGLFRAKVQVLHVVDNVVRGRDDAGGKGARGGSSRGQRAKSGARRRRRKRNETGKSKQNAKTDKTRKENHLGHRTTLSS